MCAALGSTARRVSALVAICAVAVVTAIWVLVASPSARADTTPSPTVSRSVFLPTFTLVITDSNGNTVAAVGGASASRAPTGVNTVPSDDGPLARTGSRVSNEIALAAVLLLTGTGLVMLGVRRERRTH